MKKMAASAAMDRRAHQSQVSAPPAELRPASHIVLQEVLVSNLQVAAHIGVHAHELGRRQSLTVNVRLAIESLSDDLLSQTIDYNMVVEAAQALADQRIALIETFGQRLAAACLQHPAVLRAEVLVEKPGALHLALAAARTVMERS
jgi:dihydroneopterin aldolase